MYARILILLRGRTSSSRNRSGHVICRCFAMDCPLFKALADETRVRLINVLMRYELSVNELVQILAMGQSRVSRHLKILTEAGLLKFRRDGLWVFYSVPDGGEKLDFLRAVAPFFPKNQVLRSDLSLGAKALEERTLRARQFFNAIADHWDDLNREILAGFDLPAKVLAALPSPCGVVADLGCGTGAVLAAMMTRASSVIGVDGSARMLDLCRARLGAPAADSGKVSLRIGELSHLPLANGETQFASLNLVLHHLYRPEEIFAEIKRALSRDGILFIADFMRHNDETMRRDYGDHWLGFDPAELKRVLSRSGFETSRVEKQPVARNLCLFMITARLKPS